MFEVNFNENTNIEKNIKTIKKEGKSNSYIKLLISSIILVISMTFFLKVSLTNTLLAKGMIIIVNALIATGAYMCCEIIDNIICNIRKNKAKKNLKEISNILAQNKINTNTKELANSVILNNSKKTTIEVSEDKEYTINSEEIKDKYYLFLDKDSNIQGILERTTTVKKEENLKDNKYYILEEPDIKTLEPKVTKVKKLVKTKDIKTEKQK